MSTAPNVINSLTTLIKRLEAATSRLEDIATATEIPQAVSALTSSSNVATKPSAPASPQPKPEPNDLPDYIVGFDALIENSVAKYVQASRKLDGLVASQAQKVLTGFLEQRKFLLITSKAKKPESDMAVLSELLSPTNEAMITVSAIKDSGRSSPYFNHLSAVAEGVIVLAWVTLESWPHKHIDESLGSAQYWGNRVLKEYKDKDLSHVEWVQSFYLIFSELSKYAKARFPSGLTWNANGGAPRDVAKLMLVSPESPQSTAPASSTGAPPPPPTPPGPPPPPVIGDPAVTISSECRKNGLGAVFTEINKGDAVTQSLRKVDRSEMTHKNPVLRASSLVSDANDGSFARSRSPAPPWKKPKPESMRAKKAPKKLLEDNKWIIENYEKEAEPIEIKAELFHSILISKCSRATVIIHGKANAVTVENSIRLNLIVDTLVSAVDVIKSQNFALQITGSSSTVMMDQVDGAQIYLSKQSIATKLYTSKSTGVNLIIISGRDEESREIPLPAQICSFYDEAKGELVNEIVAHSG